MKAVDQCLACYHIALAFFGKTWEWLVKKSNADKKFTLEWAAAEAKYKELVAENPEAFKGYDVSADVNLADYAGWKLKVIYWLLRRAEFVKLTDFEPKALGLKVVTFRDEQGIKDIKGVLVRPARNDPIHLYRIVEMHSGCQWSLTEEICDGAKRIRKDQPQETFSAIGSKKAASHKQDRSNKS